MTPTRRSPSIAVAFLVVVSVLVAGAAADASADKSDCFVAQTAFSECTGYIMGVDDEITPRCCRGLDAVKDLASTKDQRRALCSCILSEMLAAGKIKSGRVAALPAACRIRGLDFLPTNLGFDCSRYVQHAPLGLVCSCISLFLSFYHLPRTSIY
jgi:hypothetical protein